MEKSIVTRTGLPSINAGLFRGTVGRYASGLTVVTGHDGTEPIGFTCQSFYSVSVDPPLVSFSVMKTSTTYPRIRATGRFAVTVLSRTQEMIASQFARRGTDKWANVSWAPSDHGNPLLDGALAWLDCSIWAEHDAGDHVIVLGRVLQHRTSESSHPEPLLYFNGQYRALPHLSPQH